MPVKGCGIDLIEISRIAKALEKERFRARIYTAAEQEYLKDKGPQSWAARFAAKEAVLKSLGRGWLQGISFQDIEIKNDSRGKPFVQLGERASAEARRQGVKTFELSLSHTKELAAAYVIALGEG